MYAKTIYTSKDRIRQRVDMYTHAGVNTFLALHFALILAHNAQGMRWSQLLLPEGLAPASKERLGHIGLCLILHNTI